MTATGARQPAIEKPTAVMNDTTPAVREYHSPTVEQLCWAIVLLVAAGLRLVALGQAPLSQAEGGRALQSWTVAQGRIQDSWPGGIVDAISALLFRLFGGGDAIARLAPALAGLLLVASLWSLRPFLGRTATMAAAILVAISPLFVYDARVVGGQSAGAALAVCVVALILRFIREPRHRHLALICVLLAFGLGTDAIFLGSMLLVAGWLALRGAWLHSADVAEARAFVRGDRRLSSVLLPAAAGTLLAVSRFGTGFARLRPAAAAYWSLAFTPSRPVVPWHYAIDVLIGYGAPLLVLGLIGAWVVVRDGSWRDQPLLGLACFWLVGGFLLNLFMAGRYPSMLLLTVLPLAVLAGHAVDRGLRLIGRSVPDAIALSLAAGLVIAVFYFAIVASSFVNGGQATTLQLWAGVLLVVICLGGASVRARQDGSSVLAPAIVVLAVVAMLVDLRGTGAIRGTGDEFLAGQRTTPEGKAFARLLVSNGGGVSSVTDEALRPLTWYLRDTISSGGHGGARLTQSTAQLPAGFHGSGQPGVISRSWSPASLSATGMIRWWLYRDAWGRPQDLSVRLVVQDQ